MLVITETATAAVKTIVAKVAPGEDGGVRISDSGTAEGLELRVASAPEPTDTVVSTGGARVFLDEGAAAALDDRVLDAEQSQDGSLRFALAEQA